MNTAIELKELYEFIDRFAWTDKIYGKIDMMGMQPSQVCYIDMTFVQHELRYHYRKELDRKAMMT